MKRFTDAFFRIFPFFGLANAAVSGRSVSSASARAAVLRGYACLRIILIMAKLL